MQDRQAASGETPLSSIETLTRLCAGTRPSGGMDVLVEAVNRLMPGLEFRLVLSRGGWHRFGGVVDGAYQRVAGNIVHWVEQECQGDVDELLAKYADSSYFATRLSGKTHFLTAACGDSPAAFIQLEIEELQETLDRPLIDRDWFPDSVEEFLDPIDFPRLEPEPIGDACYRFRRITSIADLVEAAGSRRSMDNLRRFLADWSASSGGDAERFCDHWVLALREYRDQDGLARLTARPVATFRSDLPELPQGKRLSGADLANAIHDFDRRFGYPFAWYFMMLAQKAANHALADAVLADQMGVYEYLPARDLKVLRAWAERPYAV